MSKGKGKSKKDEAPIVDPKAIGFKEKEIPTIPTLDDIAVEIDEEVHAKIMHWIDKAAGEVSGLGKIEIVNGVFRVTSAILLKQENTSVTTDIDAKAVGKAMFELKDEPGQLNWWWHSHVNMDVFWSGTDLDTIHLIGQGGWFLATVLNKKREMKSAYYQKGGVAGLPGIFVDDLPTRTIYLFEESKLEQWDKDFDSKVTEKKWSYDPGKFPGSRGSLHEGYPDYYGAEIYDASRGESPNHRFLDERDSDDTQEWEHDRVYSDEEINDLVAREFARQGLPMGHGVHRRSKKKKNRSGAV